MGFNYFLDSDVILDFILKRTPFNQSAKEIFDLAFNEDIQVFFSALTVFNIHNLLRKQYGNEGAIQKIEELVSFCKILPVTEKEIFSALKSGFPDFEVAIQHFTALQDPQIEGIITRNTTHFRKSQLPIFSPESFLALFK